MRTTLRSKTGLLVVVGLLLALSPAVGRAQTGVATGTLHEVRESPPAHAAPGGPTIPGAFPPGIGGRLAQATQSGSLVGSGSLKFLTGDIEIQAQSRIPVDPTTGAFGAGTVSGVFHVDSGTGIVTAKFGGMLDLSLLTSTLCDGKPCPFAPTDGTWFTLGKNKTSGDYTGIFLLPFEIAPGIWAYLNPSAGLEFLTPDDFGKDGTPLVKFLVTLFQ